MASDPTRSAQLLTRWQDGDESAQSELIDLFYPALRRAAAGLLSGQLHISLTPGDLVHETALRLIKSENMNWGNRAQFLAIASKAMRRVLIDHVRAKQTDKRDHRRVTLVTHIQAQPNADVRTLHHALIRLAAIDTQLADIVEMRYFGGMSIADIAEVTGLSEATIKRRWTAARAWLVDALENDV